MYKNINLNILKKSGLYLIFLFFIPVSLTAQNTMLDYEKNQLFVKVKNENYSDFLQLIEQQKNKSLKTIPKVSISFQEIQPLSKIENEELKKAFLLTFVSSKEIHSIILNLENSGLFEYVEKVPIYKLFHTPNDLDHRQWYLKKVRAENAWSDTRGSCPTIIAIIDDAVDTLHPDLNPVIWRNNLEIPGNGIDDDGNGYVDDYFGWNAADNNNDPSAPSNAAPGFFDHGTHCAGIAGAQTNNNTGIASVGYDIQIMPIKVGYVSGTRVAIRNTYQAIEYAIVNKANVVSMSIGGPVSSITIDNLIKFGESRGITFVASAGNSNSSTPMYPAAYSSVISVAASDSFDRRASFSSYGTWVNIMAPGVDIYSTLPYSPGFGYKSGTSMACPLVASTIALMICKNPNITPTEIKNCLLNNTHWVNFQNPGMNGLLGSGRLDAFRAVSCVKTIIADFTSNKTRICPGQSVQFLQEAKPFPQTVSWRFPGGSPSTSSSFNPQVQYPNPGTYDVEMVVGDGLAFDTLLLVDYINVKPPSAVISGNRTVAAGSYTNIRVDLEGIAPFEIEYSNGSNSFKVSGIYQNPYYIISRVEELTTFTLLDVKDGNCSGVVSGSAIINVNTGGGGCAPEASFTKVTGGTTNEEGFSSCYIDGYIYVGGYTSTNSFGGEDAMLIKYDTSGNMVWAKVFGGTGNERIFSMAADSNHNIIMGGETTSYGGSGSINGLILLVDTSGTVINSKVYSTTAINSVTCIRPTSDRGYIVGGRNTFNSGNGQGYVLKIDSNLNHQWGRQSVSGNNYSMCFSVEEMPGVGYFATHMHRVGTTRFDNALARYNYNGSLVWYKGYGGDFNDAFRGLVAKGNEIYAYAVIRISNTNLDLVLMRLDTNGNVLASSRFHTPVFEEAEHNSIVMDSTGFYVVGKTREAISAGKWDGKIMKLTFNGEIEWQTGIGTNEFEEIQSIVLSEGNVYFTGYIENTRHGGKDVLYSKIGCVGINNCLNSDIVYTRDTMNVKHQYNISPSISNVNNLSNISSIGSRFTSLDNESLCPECESNGGVSYNKVLTDSLNHNPKFILSSTIGNYTISAAQTLINSSNHSHISLNKVTSNGNIVWAKRLNAQNYDGKKNIALAEGGSGSIYTAFNTSSSSSSNGNIAIVKLDPSGVVLWSKNIGASGNDDEVGFLHTDKDENIYLTGSYNHSGAAGNLIICKLDSSGNVAWQRIVNASGRVESRKIIQLNDNVFYVTSQTNIGTGSANPMVTKIDGSGAIIWNKLITYSGSSVFKDATLSADSSYIVILGINSNSSFGGNDFLVSAFDTALNQVWSNYYGATGQDSALAIFANNDGYIVAGNTLSFDNSTEKQLIISIDLSGSLKWSKIYGEPRVKTRFPDENKILSLNSGNNIFSIYQDRTFNVNSIGITRLDNCGNSYCHFTQVLLNQKTFSSTSVSDRAYSLSSNPALSNRAISTSSIDYKDTFVCSFIPPSIEEVDDTCEWFPDISYEAECIQSPVSFEDITTIVQGQIFSRRWHFGDGQEVLGGPTIQHKYETSGTYWVGLEITGINSDNRICRGHDSIQVIVPNQLYVEYEQEKEICVGDSIELNYSRLSCWELPIRATWTPSIGINDTSLLEPKVSPSNSKWYYVSVRDRSGNIAKDSVFVNVDLSCCKSLASFSVEKEVFCQSDSIRFINTSNALVNASYSWNFGFSANLTQFTGANPPPISFSQPRTYSIMLAVSDSCGVDTVFNDIYILNNPEMNFGLDTVLCFPDIIQIGGAPASRNEYIWNPDLGVDITVSNPIIVADRDSVITVTMIDDLTQCAVTDTIRITGFAINKVLGNDTVICEQNQVVLDVSGAGSKFLWNTGDTTPTITVDTTGLFKVLISQNICSLEDSIFVKVEKYEDLAFVLPTDTVLCEPATFTISPSKNLMNPLWNTGETSHSITVSNSGKYLLRETGDACYYEDSIMVSFENPSNISFSLGTDTTLCKGENITLAPSLTVQNPLWNNGSTTQSISVSDSGLYILTSSGLACVFSDSIRVLQEDPELFLFSLGRDTGFCDLLPYVIAPSRVLQNFVWSNGQSSPTITDINGGLYWLEERGVACTFRDSIIVDRKELPVFSLGSDTFVCENKTLTLESDIDMSSLNRVWDNGENTLSRTVSSPGTYKLKVDNGICSYEDSVEVSLKLSPVLDLPSDTTLCKGDTLFLNAFHPDINQYLWQLTSSSPEYQITQPGIYSLFTSSICLDTTYLINVEEEYCDCEIYVPSAFSPNSDNMNEIFITSFCELQQFKMEIFDRWGSKLFETNDIFEGWNGKRNGKILPAGPYLYVITLQTPAYNKGDTYKKSGTVNLIY